MRTIRVLILVTVSFSTFGQNYKNMVGQIQMDTTEAKQRFQYIQHINKDDTLCTNAVKKAEIDAKDTLYFIVSYGPFGGNLRYETELNLLAKQNELNFDYQLGSCVFFENQTEGCYKDYMDKKLFEKFGRGFKTKLHLTADSMFLVNHVNDTIIYWDCDKEPIFGNEKFGGDGINIEVNLPIKATREEWNYNGKPDFALYRPFMDIQFTVNKRGTVSSFKVDYFFNAEKPENDIYKEKLFALAVKEIETKYSKWTPAEIRGMKVNSFYVLRVQFETSSLQQAH